MGEGFEAKLPACRPDGGCFWRAGQKQSTPWALQGVRRQAVLCLVGLGLELRASDKQINQFVFPGGIVVKVAHCDM